MLRLCPPTTWRSSAGNSQSVPRRMSTLIVIQFPLYQLHTYVILHANREAGFPPAICFAAQLARLPSFGSCSTRLCQLNVCCSHFLSGFHHIALSILNVLQMFDPNCAMALVAAVPMQDTSQAACLMKGWLCLIFSKQARHLFQRIGNKY